MAETEKDINKFSHEGSRAEGCATGQHLWNEDAAEIVADGELTALRVKCSRCHNKFTMSSLLNLNDVVEKMEEAVADINKPQPQPTLVPAKESEFIKEETKDSVGEEVLNKIFG